MIDPQQTELVSVLAERADEAQWVRNTAKDRFDIASHRLQQPNLYRWKNQTTALLFAGIVSLGGTLYALSRDAAYGIPFAAGAGLGIGMTSKTLDDRRQTREKQEWLNITRYKLQRTETQLREAVMVYREEEETRWLMYALDVRKEELLALREWMADPRRTMKDAILESIDIVTTQFLQQPLDADAISQLPLERKYRQLRQRLFSPEIQLQKDEFLANLFSKHHLLRDREQFAAASSADARVKTFSLTGGTAAGLLTGSGVTAFGATMASTLGSSNAAIANTLTSTGSFAAAIGMGLLAAGTIYGWMAKTEAERRQLESQQFHDAFTIATQILEEVLQAQTASDETEQNQKLQSAWERLKAFKKRELRSQDRQLKQYVELLGDRIKQYLQSTSKRTKSPAKLRRFLG
jgi:hypothetical protein